MAISHIFRIMFVNQGKVYEIYARRVSHGELFGFIEVEELVFGERATVVVGPAEERIKGEFDGVKRTYLPLHSILRIDEVKKQGVSKITALEGSGANVAQFPMPLYTAPPPEKKYRPHAAACRRSSPLRLPHRKTPRATLGARAGRNRPGGALHS